MGFWAFFWGALLLVALLCFAVLSVVVTVGGFKEVRALFEGIERQHREEE